MAPFRLAQYSGKITTTEAEPLLQLAPYSNLRAVTRHAVALAVHPHASGSIVDLKNTGPQRSKRGGHVASDGDLFPDIPSWIAIYTLNTGARRTTRQQHGQGCS